MFQPVYFRWIPWEAQCTSLIDPGRFALQLPNWQPLGHIVMALSFPLTHSHHSVTPASEVTFQIATCTQVLVSDSFLWSEPKTRQVLRFVVALISQFIASSSLLSTTHSELLHVHSLVLKGGQKPDCSHQQIVTFGESDIVLFICGLLYLPLPLYIVGAQLMFLGRVNKVHNIYQ